MAGSSPPQSSRRWLPDVQSLQFRLTVGAVLASAIAIGGIAGWMGWRMEQNLVAQHRQRLWILADRFDDDVALYREMVPTEEAIQEVIDYRTLGDTAIWVQSPQGEAMAQSESLKLTAWQSNGLVQRLQALSPEKRLERITLGDRTLLICIQPLVVGEDALGTLFIAKDVTADQQSLRMLITHLAWISGAMVVLLTVAMAIYVRRSLRPLQVMGQQVTTVTAEDLHATRLDLDRAPTEVRTLAQTLDSTLARLADVWDQQQRLLGDVSHELRTPLAVVQGYLQSTLRRCQTLTAVQREGLETAAAETDRTIRILQDLLVLARAGMGRLPLTLERHDLKAIVVEAVALAATPPPTDELPSSPRLETQIEVAPLFAWVDPSALHQILVQLMENALHYSGPQQIVTVHLTEQADEAMIQVQDQGRGIPLADQAKIFEPFYRVDSDRCRATGGTGLGLAIVKTLIEAMGGRVTVQSTLGQGSTFTLRFPLTAPPDA
jgi:signal transduction histidine kinase